MLYLLSQRIAPQYLQCAHLTRNTGIQALSYAVRDINQHSHDDLALGREPEERDACHQPAQTEPAHSGPLHGEGAPKCNLNVAQT